MQHLKWTSSLYWKMKTEYCRYVTHSPWSCHLCDAIWKNLPHGENLIVFLVFTNKIKSTLSRTFQFLLYGINIQSYRLLKLIKNKTLTFWFLQNFHVRDSATHARLFQIASHICTILTESLWHWFKHAEYLRIWTSIFEVWVYIAWMHWKYTYAWAFESTSESIHVHYLCTKKQVEELRL